MRVRGSRINDSGNPTVSIISLTEKPRETLVSLWYGSRHVDDIYPDILTSILYLSAKIENNEELLEKVHYTIFSEYCEKLISEYPEHSEITSKQEESISVVSDLNKEKVELITPIVRASNVIKALSRLVVKCDVPASESVQFTFEIDNCSVALREQLVRSKFASYWTQTSRTADLTNFDTMTSESIKENEQANSIYVNTLNTVRDAYKDLIQLGIPTEDIRLAPESRVHKVYWMISLRAIKPILSKRCLSGDTRIRLANGTIKKIKDLPTDEDIWIYSFNTLTNKFEISKARSLGITKSNAKLVRVNIDNDKYIECTPDHLFMMSDGTYKKAEDLDPNDSLMAMYTRLSDYKSMKGYEEIYDKYNDSWYYTHWISSDNIEYPEESLDDDFYVRHHKDFNKLNNDPTNIEFVPFKEHFKIHSNSDHSKELAKKHFEDLWKDPDWREWKVNSIKEYCGANLVEYNKLESTRKAHGERNKLRWLELKSNNYDKYLEECEKLSKKAKEQWKPGGSLDLSHRKYKRVQVVKECPVCGKEYEVTETYDKSTGELVYGGRVTCSKSCAATYRNYGRYRNENHKVVSVEYLDYTEDVYDITVPDNHNFVVDLEDGSGVVVHNCDWMAQATLWTPVIEGVINELSQRNIADLLVLDPPIKIQDGKVIFHKYDNENEDRYYGRDPQPCDPLWLAYRGLEMPENTNRKMYFDMKSKFIKLWSQEVCDVIGWDKSAPEKLGMYDPK